MKLKTRKNGKIYLPHYVIIEKTGIYMLLNKLYRQ